MGAYISTHMQTREDAKEPIAFYGFEHALAQPALMDETIKDLLGLGAADAGAASTPITHVVGIESRGFIVAALAARYASRGLVLARKPGKLPGKVRQSAPFSLEYRASERLEIQEGAFGDNPQDARVVVCDDVYATGGTVRACVELVQSMGAQVVRVVCPLVVQTLPQAQLATQMVNMVQMTLSGAIISSKCVAQFGPDGVPVIYDAARPIRDVAEPVSQHVQVSEADANSKVGPSGDAVDSAGPAAIKESIDQSQGNVIRAQVPPRADVLVCMNEVVDKLETLKARLQATGAQLGKVMDLAAVQASALRTHPVEIGPSQPQALQLPATIDRAEFFLGEPVGFAAPDADSIAHRAAHRADADSAAHRAALQRDNDVDCRALVMALGPMQALARGIADVYPALFRYTPMLKDETFPDGYPDVQFVHPNLLRGRDCVFLMDLSDVGDFVRQQSVAIALARQGCRRFFVINPYFAPGTMERVEVEGVVATAETVMKLMTATLDGGAYLATVDPHASVTRFYASDKVSGLHEIRAVPIILDHILANANQNNTKVAIVFPDEGSYKRARALIPSHVPYVVCAKQRLDNGERRITVLSCENLPNGVTTQRELFTTHRLVILDDLVQTGGTLAVTMRELCDKMADFGVPEEQRKVDVAVTHAVFPNRSWKRFMPEGDAHSRLGTFWVTNTVPRIVRTLESYAFSVLEPVGFKSPFQIVNVSIVLADHVLSMIHPARELARKPGAVVRSKITAFVGSSSKVKIGALRDIGINAVAVAGVNSGVGDQPVGLDKTELGAASRMNQAWAYLTSSTDPEVANAIATNRFLMAVGIENGLDPETRRDYIIVVARVIDLNSPNKLPENYTAKAFVTVPEKYWNIGQQEGFKRTIGAIVSETVPHADPHDWYIAVGMPKSRRSIISSMMLRLINPHALLECIL